MDDEPVSPEAADPSAGSGQALLDEWPVPEPRDWVKRVNEPDTPAELEALRRCVPRGRPCGGEAWVARIAARLGLEASLRPTGRPPKPKKAE